MKILDIHSYEDTGFFSVIPNHPCLLCFFLAPQGTLVFNSQCSLISQSQRSQPWNWRCSHPRAYFNLNLTLANASGKWWTLSSYFNTNTHRHMQKHIHTQNFRTISIHWTKQIFIECPLSVRNNVRYSDNKINLILPLKKSRDKQDKLTR